ncbi:hypothetical protein AOCH_003849 [Aspergillus ochraceoroseus]|uniref:Uncharacterized protein n=1 Tax=Aspergillus ochraceoroseus TaxID=138278 RepID=A0A0F8U5X0_9EURO|nr:hypothetical protein AOCH_003849 [Aspergillus ochraceoroseus]
MSTFDGFVREFPFIRIDYFRKNPQRPPPLACFLSHVHSDHLQGLESFRAPFIYCSSATRELLLRIEKYPHRINFNNGVLECRRLHYKHLSKFLRPVPLNTPTEIDLTPRLSIRVTLLDANHCAGAVMFLIEGDGKAILYTGDIRAEAWWVNSLIRHPILIPYTLGNKRLDKIYLDTTFAHTSHAYDDFPSKAEGIAELLRKLEPYPEDIKFYFRAWTFGYEEVWTALSAALKSKANRYQMGLYISLSSREGYGTTEVPFLCGFELGNGNIPGCLSDDEKSRIHSCEPGAHCSAIMSNRMVYISPIVSRTNDGFDVPEVGAGGGGGDLYQTHELELPDQSALERLELFCRERIHDPQVLSKTREALLEAFKSKNRALSLDSYGMKDAQDMPLEELVEIISRGSQSEELELPETLKTSMQILDKSGNPLPRTIHFPYSRHSSYAESCNLIAAFKPKDIHPCTVDPLSWNEHMSMQNLFGHLCSDNQFEHDEHMRVINAITSQRSRKRARYDHDLSTQSTQHSSIMTISSDSDHQLSRIPLTHEPSEAKVGSKLNEASQPESPHRSAPQEPLEPPSSHQIQISIPSSTEIPNISSRDTTSEPIQFSLSAPNQPLKLPPSTPESTVSKQAAIHQAWRFLHDAQQHHKHFHLGSPPSSWAIDDREPRRRSETDTAIPIPIPRPFPQPHAPPATKNLDLDPQPEESKSEPNPYFISRTPNPIARGQDHETPMEIGIINTNTEPETNTGHDPSSQQSHSLSVSSSAFAFSGQEQTEDQRVFLNPEDKSSALSDGDEREMPDDLAVSVDPDLDPETRGGPSLQRERSTRARKAAYLAAKADSYDAWASISLVSAGNNHTEEEIEL